MVFCPDIAENEQACENYATSQPFFKIIYRKFCEKVMGSESGDLFWVDGAERKSKIDLKICRSVQEHCVACAPFTFFLMHLFVRFRQWLSKTGLTLEGFVSVPIKRYGQSEPSKVDAKKSAVHWFIGTVEVEAGNS